MISCLSVSVTYMLVVAVHQAATASNLHGIFAVQSQIGDERVRLLVDTGSPLSFITAQAAARIDPKLSPGDSVSGKLSKLPSGVKIPKLVVMNRESALSSTGFDGLLGMDALSNCVLGLDLVTNELTTWSPQDANLETIREWLKFPSYMGGSASSVQIAKGDLKFGADQLPRIQVQKGMKTYSLLFDTGASMHVFPYRLLSENKSVKVGEQKQTSLLGTAMMPTWMTDQLSVVHEEDRFVLSLQSNGILEEKFSPPIDGTFSPASLVSRRVVIDLQSKCYYSESLTGDAWKSVKLSRLLDCPLLIRQGKLLLDGSRNVRFEDFYKAKGAEVNQFGHVSGTDIVQSLDRGDRDGLLLLGKLSMVRKKGLTVEATYNGVKGKVVLEPTEK